MNDTRRLDFLLEWRATVQCVGAVYFVQDNLGRLHGKDNTPRGRNQVEGALGR